MDIELNEIQTSIENLHLENEPEEVVEQFWDFFTNVPYIQLLTSKNRPRAKDLPRDEEGRIIIDITNPHILEDMDYFRPTAIHFQKHGCYTFLKPNSNPNSEYGKWIKEEIRRCYEGYIRPSDGEWITGDHYFFLNYCPIELAKTNEKNVTSRVVDMPTMWEGHYYKFHYLNQARNEGKHAGELASRGRGKSFCGASLLGKRFILGESKEANKKVQCIVLAGERKFMIGGKQILDMFQSYLDHCATTTQFPARRLMSSSQQLQWIMGYIDVDTGVRKGTLNSVMGITCNEDESKPRGTRGVLYLIEEAGTFKKLLKVYQVIQPSVSDGEQVWGTIFLYGTAGDSESDFSSMQELMYHPIGYKIKANKNIYDKVGQGKKDFVYFFPGYVNMAQCYDNNGNSDVTKALLYILKERYALKYNSTDINAITKKIAEIPITPQEAITRTQGSKFPITQLTERLNQIDNDPNSLNDVYIGNLSLSNNGEVKFVPSNDIPIRSYPLKDNKAKGAIEIFNMPEKNKEGKIYNERYIIGHDPVDNDEAESMSLTSTFVMDLWTDKIVAEYTGRQEYADYNYEIVRLLCLFYNAKCLYESNKKAIFPYFSRMNCLHLLADTPEYLRDKQLIKYSSFGSASKGVNASAGINNYADTLIREWLIKPTSVIIKKEGEDVETTIPNLYNIRNRALLQELISYNPDANFDRIRALGMLMLYREEKIILYQGDTKKSGHTPSDYAGNDKFFKINYDNKKLYKI